MVAWAIVSNTCIFNVFSDFHLNFSRKRAGGPTRSEGVGWHLSSIFQTAFLGRRTAGRNRNSRRATLFSMTATRSWTCDRAECLSAGELTHPRYGAEILLKWVQAHVRVRGVDGNSIMTSLHTSGTVVTAAVRLGTGATERRVNRRSKVNSNDWTHTRRSM